MESPEQVGFDSYGSTVKFNNSYNANILPEEDMFNDKIDPIIYNGVENIGGKYLIPKGVVTVRWYWIENEGKLHTNKFNNALYDPDSPVNIISATALAEYMKNDEGTWVLTKREYYIFT